MASEIWLCLSSGEQALLREALSIYRYASEERLGRLLKKVDHAKSLPETILRVEDGFVEIEGNPNAVRVYDYDCDGIEDENLNPDEEGRSCILSEYEPSTLR
jgi:hypothetical protein